MQPKAIVFCEAGPDIRDRNFEGSKFIDRNPESYWAIKDIQTSGEVIIDLAKETEVNSINNRTCL